MNLMNNNQAYEYTSEKGNINLMGNNNTFTLKQSDLHFQVNGNNNTFHLQNNSTMVANVNGNNNKFHVGQNTPAKLTIGFNGNNNQVFKYSNAIVNCSYSNGHRNTVLPQEIPRESRNQRQPQGNNNNRPNNQGNRAQQPNNQGNRAQQPNNQGANNGRQRRQFIFNQQQGANQQQQPNRGNRQPNFQQQQFSQQYGNGNYQYPYQLQNPFSDANNIFPADQVQQNQFIGSNQPNQFQQNQVQIGMNYPNYMNNMGNMREMQNMFSMMGNQGFMNLSYAINNHGNPIQARNRGVVYHFNNLDSSASEESFEEEEEPIRGLTKEQMNFLQKNKHQAQDGKCSICLCDITKGEEETYLICFHVFHSQCIFDWLARNSKCPVCQHDQKRHLE